MIRTATAADRPVLVSLQGLLPERAPTLLDHALAAGDVLVSSAAVASDPWETAGAADRATDSSAGVPVGYLLSVDGTEAHVAELVVAPGYRREGRASALLRALFASLPVGRRVTVAVAPDNRAALALYRAAGFAEVGRRERYFESGPALLLARVVTGSDARVADR